MKPDSPGPALNSRLLLLVCILLVCATGPTAIAQTDRMREINPHIREPLEIDPAKVEAAGIRVLQGQYVTIYTDINGDPSIDELPAVFDQAVPQWCEYFEVDPERTRGWKISTMVMQDGERFKLAGLLPDDLPDFPAGFNRGHESWVYLQVGDYYTRHLVIHEGTHAFMTWFLGGTGTAWFSEGMAELLGVHRWESGALTLRHRALSADELPYWGRPKIIRDARENGEIRSLSDIFAFAGIDYREVDLYAWSWAATRFLSNHPESREQFRSMFALCDQRPLRFARRLETKLSRMRSILDRDWQLYVAEQDYGFEIARGILIDAPPSAEVEPDSETAPAETVTRQVEIRVDHSWQATDIQVHTGEKLVIQGSGSFQVGETTQPWTCEAGGVTLQYHRGRPLGMLLAGIVAEDGSVGDLIAGHSIGLGAELESAVDGRLCLRINDSPARMDDNAGTLSVRITRPVK